MKELQMLALLMMPMVFGCQKPALSGGEYMQYVEKENNGLKHIKQIGDMSFQMQYCPTEYLLLNEYKTEYLPHEVVEERLINNDSMLFFKLRIKADGSNDVLNYQIDSGDDYYARVQYLSYGFEENIALVQGIDTIFPALFHFERTYGIAPFADFMLAFNAGIGEDDSFQILVDDKVFDNGLLKFSYKEEDIRTIPELITQ